MLPLRDTVPARSWPVVTWLLIAANVAVFVFENSLSNRQLDQLVITWGVVPAQLWSGRPVEWLTVVSSMFLHGGWLHLISNMWALAIFGDNVEDRMGGGRYLAFYLIGGVSAALVQTAADPAARTPMIGASGAIAAVLAAYLVLFPGARVITLVPVFFLPWLIEIPAVLYLGLWFLSQFFSGLLALDVSAAAGGVAYWAHIGGFLAGLLLVGGFARRPRVEYTWSPPSYRW